jgi:RimJ/RimL family protein N-acetyltransferase
VSVVLRGERVTLRPWTDADLAPFAALNADPEVTRFLIKPLSREESDAMAQRLRTRIDTQGYGAWALDVPAIGFAGFVGVNGVPFDLDAPGIVAEPQEIGWRLARAAWGKGYATEAAALALRHAFEVVGLPQVVSFTASANRASEAVMQRIGLTKRGEFEHPRVAADSAIRHHVLYAADAPSKGTP